MQLLSIHQKAVPVHEGVRQSLTGPLGPEEIGVELISAVQCQMAHARYFVVETEDYSKLHELFSPFQGIAIADLTPVRDLMSP